MTREERENAIKCLNLWIEREPQLQTYKTALEALEQYPILDKIRAKIEQAANKQFKIAMGVADLNERYAHIQMENAYRHSLNIIDEYGVESEDKGISVVIRGFNKPKNCYNCHFNDNDCCCSITKGIINRDDYTCNILCPIEQISQAEKEDKK